jgi:hypothetical protein
MTGFTELLGVAIANADGRDQLRTKMRTRSSLRCYSKRSRERGDPRIAHGLLPAIVTHGG